MATKNFSQMTTKKLNALLATASDDDKAKIQAELDARAAIAAEPAALNHTVGGAESNDVVMGELTPEEQAQLDAAEANGGKVAKAPRLTEEERQAIIDNLKATVVGHKCEVLPMGKANWVPGVITGIMNDKRANNIMLNIKLEDGRLIRKMHNAETLRVLDEMAEVAPAARRGRKAGTGEPKEVTPWTTQNEEMATAAENIGKVVSLDGVELGRIHSIVPDKRVKMILYKIVVPGNETKPAKTIHKSTKTNLVFSELDEVGQKLHDEFIARREKAANRPELTPEQKIAKMELDLQAAKERALKAQTKVAELEEALARLYAEATAVVDQTETAEVAEPVDNEDLA